MGIIKQLKQFLTGEDLFPITKTNAVYDNTLGRLDTLMQNIITESEVDNIIPELVRNIKNPFNNNLIAPVTKTRAVYNEDGSRLDKYIEALMGASSNNILVNSNFANPVNQRAYISGTNTSANTGNTFVMDRWQLSQDDKTLPTSLTFNNGYVTVNAKAGITFNSLFQQVEFPRSYAGKFITVSAEYRCTNGSKACLYAYNSSASNTDVYPYTELICDGEWHTASLTFMVNGDIEWLSIYISPGTFEFVNGNATWNTLAKDTQLDIKWVKAEVGEIATPYVPRLYAEELQLCKRYYREITGFKAGVTYTTDTITFIFDALDGMRSTSPSVKFKNALFEANGVYLSTSGAFNSTTHTGFNFALDIAAHTNMVRCTATKSAHGMTSDTTVIVVPVTNPICIDAEL